MKQCRMQCIAAKNISKSDILKFSIKLYLQLFIQLSITNYYYTNEKHV